MKPNRVVVYRESLKAVIAEVIVGNLLVAVLTRPTWLAVTQAAEDELNERDVNLDQVEWSHI